MAGKKFQRLTAEQTSGKQVQIDPRCWRTIYWVRLMLQQELGFMPSFDYALSEVLVDPERGVRMLTAARSRYKDVVCPQSFAPQGNRFRASVNPNLPLKAGKRDQDWGV